MPHSKEREEILDLTFSSGGLLARLLPDYEHRTEQREMAEQILNAYFENEIALVEAGTGTGKSLAYLVPAVFWALKHKEKTLISTHTIALQEQLLNKDIPFLLKALDVDIKAVLVKGMSNYVCLRKLKEQSETLPLLATKEDEEIELLRLWGESTLDGTRSEISFPLSPSSWQKVSAESESCTHIACPHYKECFFFRARKQAQDAHLLIVNHHMLFTDLSKKEEGEQEKAPLPRYDRVILDEAHHLEETALDVLSQSADHLGLVRLLETFFSDAHPEGTLLLGLLQIFIGAKTGLSQREVASLQQRMQIDLPAERRALLTQMASFFEKLEGFSQKFTASSGGVDKRGKKCRMTIDIMRQYLLEEELPSLLSQLVFDMKRFGGSANSLKKDLEGIDQPSLKEKFRSPLAELQMFITKLEEHALFLESFFSKDCKKSHVRWMEISSHAYPNVSLIQADLDVASYLEKHLFAPSSSVALCSATMTAKNDFSHIKDRLGIAKSASVKTVTEKIYPSPFDYQKRTLLLVPTDIPNPSEREFTQAASRMIIQALLASQGNAFVLFTSYEMLRAAFELVSQVPELKKYSFLRQGDASRMTLLERFKTKGCVLFGTDSFWEGVDIAGEALRCVIIVKLPFHVPTDPLHEAQAEFLEQEGKDPFYDLSLPSAVMQFKQGFGRLMRKKSDRGCIVCLDKRLLTKSYGKVFLKSLPECPTVFENSNIVFDRMQKFYEETSGKEEWSVAGSNR